MTNCIRNYLIALLLNSWITAIQKNKEIKKKRIIFYTRSIPVVFNRCLMVFTSMATPMLLPEAL